MFKLNLIVDQETFVQILARSKLRIQKVLHDSSTSTANCGYRNSAKYYF